MHSRFQALAIVLAIVPVSSALAQNGTAAIPAPAQGAWPKATPRQGQYFSWAEPVGWKVTESTNGVQ